MTDTFYTVLAWVLFLAPALNLILLIVMLVLQTYIIRKQRIIHKLLIGIQSDLFSIGGAMGIVNVTPFRTKGGEIKPDRKHG